MYKWGNEGYSIAIGVGMTKNLILNIVLHSRNEKHDIEVPYDISAYELIVGLTKAYELGIDLNDIKQCYLRSENPIALLKGNKTLEEFELHNGTIIHVLR